MNGGRYNDEPLFMSTTGSEVEGGCSHSPCLRFRVGSCPLSVLAGCSGNAMRVSWLGEQATFLSAFVFPSYPLPPT